MWKSDVWPSQLCLAESEGLRSSKGPELNFTYNFIIINIVENGILRGVLQPGLGSSSSRGGGEGAVEVTGDSLMSLSR